VASFFVSRIDASVEKKVASELEEATDGERKQRLEGMIAKVAIANAIVAYSSFRNELAGERWKKLADQGARPQRVLWASTGTKSPTLPPTLYVDSLIGSETVNTVPGATFEAFRKQGQAADALGEDGAATLDRARGVLSELDALGISLGATTDELLKNGCKLFVDAFDQLLAAVASKRDALAEQP
jgi:transaldolase/glucose-6-phosphate isomerase